MNRLRSILHNLTTGVVAGALAGAVTFLIDAIITIARARGHVAIPVVLRLLPTAFTLGLILGTLVGLVQGAVLAIILGGRRVEWLLEPVGDDQRPRYWGITPYLWAGAIAMAAFFVATQRVMRGNMRRYNARDLIASQSALQAVMFALALILLGVLVVRGARILGRLFDRMDSANPFRSPGAALFVLGFPALVLAAIVLYVVARNAPAASGLAAMRQRMPPQLFSTLLCLAILDLAILRAGAGGLRIIPAHVQGKRRQQVAGGIAAGLAIVILGSLFFWGGNQPVKALAEVGSPLMGQTVALVRRLNDFDRDGVGSVLGERDCAPFNRHVHPGAIDIPDNGIDENCWGGDLSAKSLVAPPGQAVPVPPEFRRPYNVLLLTVDTVRYDHTGMGGYKQKTGRDTTPNLDKLAAESVIFTDVHAPSAGTMASMPAILTSKFFHSGIALGPDRPHKGPLILPENRLIGEVMKDAGYRTGAIVTHDYFVDWGTDQGIDDYDQEIAARPRDAFLVSADTVTDKALAWIANHAGHKWFLWAHYLDPHGRYVAHPDKSFGSTEEDLYDGEIYFTDKHIGRLLDSLRKNRNLWSNTIVVITSDHGDGFNEHGIINHAVALYREIIQVPLIIRIPELAPRTSDQLASPLDVLPTLAELVGAPIGKRVEGMSLVGPIFYDRKDAARVVFSETNLPVPQRAAITKEWKLIGNIRSNTYQLYDRRSDPLERNNVYGQNASASKDMQRKLQQWLDRLFFARDESFNQSYRNARVNFVDKIPEHLNKAEATWMDAIELVGWESLPPPPWPQGAKPVVTVYFRSLRTISESLRFELMLAGDAPPGPDGKPATYHPSFSSSIVFGGGFAATSSWQPGDLVRESLALEVRPDFPMTSVDLRVRLTNDAAAKHQVPPRSPSLVDAEWVSMGAVPLGTPGAKPPPPSPSPPPAPSPSPSPSTAAPPAGTPAPGTAAAPKPPAGGRRKPR